MAVGFQKDNRWMYTGVCGGGWRQCVRVGWWCEGLMVLQSRNSGRGFGGGGACRSTMRATRAM
jgi:hypothetical protein